MDANSSGIGTAVVSTPTVHRTRPRIATDGECVRETLRAMGRDGQGLPRPALEAIRTQAADVVGSILEAYATHVGEGEVGADGRALAADAPALDHCPTGLLYGRVQSGKTAGMIASTAMAIDNGFRVFVVLTSNNLKLVKQTKDRYRALDGALIYSSLDGASGTYEWNRDKHLIRQFMGERGVVFVCAKESSHLNALIDFLQEIHASRYPALILDDEADHATPDTTRAKKSKKKPVAYSSTTFRYVVENDNPEEPGRSIRETLRHNVLLQVTATPYGLLLQSLGNQLRPAFTRLLQPGQGYTGGEAFFEVVGESPDGAQPPLVYVAEEEAATLSENPTKAPPGLVRSIACFLVSATAHRLVTETAPAEGYKYLCHTSSGQEDHSLLERLICGYIDEFSSHLRRDAAAALERAELQWAFEEMSKQVDRMPDREEFARELLRYLPRRKILVVNSQDGGELDFDGRYNFIVGGNILGRGLTIDNLLVTYYLRQARVSQMDTMHQHARMYGYRQGLMPYTRVFLTHTLAQRFQQIHDSERALRELLTDGDSMRSIPVHVAGKLRSTRSNILDVGAISAYRPGQQVYPVEPVHDPKQLGDSVERIEAYMAELWGGIPETHKMLPITLDQMKRLVDMVAVQPDDGEWNTEALSRVLESLKGLYPDGGYLYIRDFRRSSTTLSSGALSSKEQEQARSTKHPVLFMIRGEEGQPWDAPIVYPTVVFPKNMPAMVFNSAE